MNQKGLRYEFKNKLGFCFEYRAGNQRHWLRLYNLQLKRRKIGRISLRKEIQNAFCAPSEIVFR